MAIPQNIIVQQTLERHRLSLPALASRLGVAVDDLGAQTLEKGLYRQVEALSTAQPEPLVAVNDVLIAEGKAWYNALLEDSRKLANKILALTTKCAHMDELREIHLTALNHLRLYVYGKTTDTGYDYLVPQKVWLVARPVEQLLESWVEANNLVAQQRVYGELLGAKKQLEFLREERLPILEESLGRLAAVHAVLDDFDQKYEELTQKLEDFDTRRERLMTEAPLSYGSPGQEVLSLSAQMPLEAKAQAMAEKAVAALKASQQTDNRELKQKGKRREQEVVENHFHQLLAALQAEQQPGLPTITTAELAPEKAAKGTPKASPATKLKKVLGLATPKAPKVKAEPQKEENLTETAPTTSNTAGAPEAPQPIATTVAQQAAGKVTDKVVAAHTAKALPPAAHSPAPQQAPDIELAEVPGEEEALTREAALYKDTGLRQPGWKDADEEVLRRVYLNKNKGYFSSKEAFAAIQNNIMILRHAREMGMDAPALNKLFKTLRWGNDDDDDPPLPT